MNEIPEEVRKLFPDQPTHLMDIDDNGNLQVLASAEPLSNEPDFENMPKEQIDQYLREHGYDPKQVEIRGKIFVEALIENSQLRARITELTIPEDVFVVCWNAVNQAKPKDKWNIVYEEARYKTLDWLAEYKEKVKTK